MCTPGIVAQICNLSTQEEKDQQLMGILGYTESLSLGWDTGGLD